MPTKKSRHRLINALSVVPRLLCAECEMEDEEALIEALETARAELKLFLESLHSNSLDSPLDPYAPDTDGLGELNWSYF